MDLFEIARSIVKKLEGSLNKTESNSLEDWLDQSEERKSLMRDITNQKNLVDGLKEFESFDISKSWNLIHRRISVRKLYAERRLRWLKVASVIVLMLGIGFLMKFYFVKDQTNYLTQNIEPGSFSAILSIEGEDEIVLKKNVSTEVVTKNEKIASVSNGHLEYSKRGQLAPVKMEIIVPEKSEFHFTLSDGSEIWMNAGSRAVFYQPFTDQNRTVYIEGEAFFKVAKDASSPFKVDLCDKDTIEVLGTSFNVEAYPGDGYHQSVLVEGSIRFSNENGEYIMMPGHLLTCDLESKRVSIVETDTYPYVAWKEGRFVFEGESLEHIMNALSRWYGVDVKFESDKIKEMGYSMDIRKYEDLNTILGMLEVTNKVQFEINNSVIIIKEK